jgi:dipeptidyl aminopeptidase/acylaminoacyl peptidase
MVSRPVPRLSGAMFAGLVAAAAPAAPAAAGCADLIPQPIQPGPRGAITPLDLLRLRDIGYPDAVLSGGPSPLALAPDGRRIAFVIRRADPDTNGYCQGLVVLALAPGSRPALVDRGGELITVTDVQRGMFVRGGLPALNIPAWSPDGQWLAYLKRIGGRTQAWRVRADGTRAAQVTHALSDVEGVAWSSDDRSLLYATRPALPALAAAITREGQSGWLYDARVVTFSGPRPQIRERDAPLAAFAIDPDTGAERPATAEEASRRELAGLAGLIRPASAASPDGRRAWLAPDGPGIMAPGRLHAADASGTELHCPEPACLGGIIALWWSADGQELRYVRRQGWNNEETALYRWRPGQGGPKMVLVTTDALIGCIPDGATAICARESPARPRRLVAIDLANGRSSLVFDPNPEFARLDLGTVERLHVRTNIGLPAWADLVLPPGYRPGTKLPLVVVQYNSRGFLRGGTGDEYPIFPLAARGYAVLSFEKAPFAASLDPTITDWNKASALNDRNWADRRSLLSAIETAVQLTIARGIADPQRIGISGVSDGATTVRFAMINSKLFAAASISSCCLEPWTVNTYAGIAFAEFAQATGYPSLLRPDPKFWQAASLAMNATRVDTPLLMQLNDDDGYLIALEAFESLREAGKPVEMYVFPGEFHIKWQPVHRLAIYRRNLDWFDFWLRGIEDPDAAKVAQYQRWRGMRARRGSAPS